MNEILNNIMNYLEIHKNFSYIILFLWAMWESIFPLSFFMYWEIFFLSGAILAWYWILNIYIVAPLLILGWFFGDNISYFILKKYGYNILYFVENNKYLWKFLNKDKIYKVEKFFKQKWWMAVLIARFSWPLARITPFIAGTFKLKYNIFLKYDILGVLGWIGMFIVVWYFFWKNFEGIIGLIYNYIFELLILIIILLLILIYIKKIYFNKKKWIKK